MKNTKEHILTVALGLFLKNSFKGVTMNEIVKTTGMSKGAFYHYFKSKEALFLAILDEYYSKFMIQDFSSFSHDSLYQFSREMMFDYGNKPQCAEENELHMCGDMNYVFLVLEGIRLFPSFRKKALEHQKREIDAWTEIIGIARKKGEIKSVMTDDQIANIFVFTTDGVGLRAIMSNGTAEEKRKEILGVWDGFYNQIKA
jgi:TetR/AcrR family transcriptional regulator, transcriptional repressor for nem operon